MLVFLIRHAAYYLRRADALSAMLPLFSILRC